ncbi:MAG: hypothetical protein JNL94_09785 [Planctomycetes bacterium]|nr:hypothetical protein [Planctomycetota bacterium]
MTASERAPSATTRGFSMVEVAISATLLSLMFYVALSSYTGSMRGTTAGTAQLEAMANSSKALIAMNLELQEASVRDETVQIWPIDADNTLATAPVDSAATPPPGTLYPTTNAVGNSNFAIRFMTIGGFVNVGGNSMEIEEAGPFIYRLGYGTAGDFPLDHLVRIDQSGVQQPRTLCRGVEQIVFQRDSRGGQILIRLVTSSRDPISGQDIQTTQRLVVTPKNDFSANLSNFDMNGEEF